MKRLIDYFEEYEFQSNVLDSLKRKLQAPKYSHLLAMETVDSDNLSSLHSAVKDTILEQPFDEQVDALAVINDFFVPLKNTFWTASRDCFCQYEKIFKPIDTYIRLIKYLHGGSNPGEEYQHNRFDIANKFGVSINTIDNNLRDLQDGVHILGSNIKIDLRRGVNNYDNTVHPVFLALNLSEVYFLTIVLKKLTEKTNFSDAATVLIADIYRQLSDYAKDIIDVNATNEEITLFEKDVKEYETGYREEKSNDLHYLLKTREPCLLVLKSKLGQPIKGQIIWHKDEVVFRSDDGEIYKNFQGEIYSLRDSK